MVAAGEGYRIHVTGLTHDERGYPVMNAKAHEWNVARLVDKIRANRGEIIQFEERDTDGAEVVVVSYGISARTSLWPIEQARQEGIRVGYLRLITVWPFPDEVIARLAKGIGRSSCPRSTWGKCPARSSGVPPVRPWCLAPTGPEGYPGASPRVERHPPGSRPACCHAQ